VLAEDSDGDTTDNDEITTNVVSSVICPRADLITLRDSLDLANQLVPSHSAQAGLITRINDILSPILNGSSVIDNGKVGYRISNPIRKDLLGRIDEYNTFVSSRSSNQPSNHGSRKQRRRSRRKATTITRNNPKITSTNPYGALSSDE
jgi:hypothetical protein